MTLLVWYTSTEDPWQTVPMFFRYILVYIKHVQKKCILFQFVTVPVLLCEYYM